MSGWSLSSFRLPLFSPTEKQAEKLLAAQIKRLSPFAVLKPSRRLGAGWTHDKVDQRKAVIHCNSCVWRYSGWWKRNGYHADWQWRWRGDCDGCSSPDTIGTLFLPEEIFYTSLSDRHGKLPKP